MKVGESLYMSIVVYQNMKQDWLNLEVFEIYALPRSDANGASSLFRTSTTRLHQCLPMLFQILELACWALTGSEGILMIIEGLLTG